MKLSRKLEYYKSTKRKTGKPEDASKIPPGLRAIREHFSAEILFAPAPVLRIRDHITYKHKEKKPIDLSLLSKGQITRPVDLEKCLFFDLETTGLSGGTGTYAFLIGFAYLSGESIVCDQYFLPDYGREPELFKQLLTWFGQFNFFVSYNGKSYDMPLLRNRFRLNRQATAFSETVHIDLVHYCRRIWKDSIPACNLGTIEALLLDDVQRSGDIPGAYIPQAYFDYLSTGRIHDIIRIIEHNRQDLISMPLILGQLGNIGDALQNLPLDAPAIYRLANLTSDVADLGFLTQLETLANQRLYALEPLWRQKAMLLKKAKRLEEATELWKQLDGHPRFFCEAARELAMVYEHVHKDYKQALQHVQQAMRSLEMQVELGDRREYDQWYASFKRRRQRLVQKVHKVIEKKGN